MKKLFTGMALLLVCLSLIIIFPLNVHAEGEKKAFLALGADLTDEQKATVLGKFGLSEEDVSGMTVSYVTNELEHKYLDGAVPASEIGTKSISCVLVRPADPGTGIRVTTENIGFCTISMYKNALLTSGVEDAEVHVAAPFQVSGTAALVGAWMAYEQMTGESLKEEGKNVAVDEMVTMDALVNGAGENAAVDSTTGESISKEVAEEIFSYIKAKVVSEGLDDPEKIAALIEEAQTKYNVTLTDSQKEKIADLMPEIAGLDIDAGKLLQQAGDLYDKYGDTVLANAKELYSEVVTDEVKQSFGNAFKTLLLSILDSITKKIQNH